MEFARAGTSPVYCSCFFPFTLAPLVAILQYPWSSWNASGPAKPGVSRAERGCLDVTTSRSLQRWVNIGKNDDPNKHGTWRNWRLVAWIFWKKTASWWILLYWLVVSTHLKKSSQNGHLPQIGMNIKNIWKHHLEAVLLWEKKSPQPQTHLSQSRCNRPGSSLKCLRKGEGTNWYIWYGWWFRIPKQQNGIYV